MSSSDNYTFTSAKGPSHSVDSRRGLPAADLPRIPLEGLPARESSRSVRPVHVKAQPASGGILGTPATTQTQEPPPSVSKGWPQHHRHQDGSQQHRASQQTQRQQASSRHTLQRRTVLRTTAHEYRSKYRQRHTDEVLEPGVEGFGVGSRPSAAKDRRRAVDVTMLEVRGLLSRTACNARLGFLFPQ